MRWMFALAAATVLHGASPVQSLLQILPREAADFSRCAVRLYSQETLTHQDAATPKPRQLTSDYSFVQMLDATGAIREVRQMRELDGKPVKTQSSLETMAQAFAAGSEKQKRQQLEQLAKHGIAGAATDLGQMLLMFTAQSLPNYEFRYTGDEAAMSLFTFVPIDNASATVRVFEAGKKQVQQPKFKGILWLRKQDQRLAKIAIDSEAVNGQRQRLIVDYEPNPVAGCVMPVAAAHREIASNGAVIVENRYTYQPFRPLSERPTNSK